RRLQTEPPVGERCASFLDSGADSPPLQQLVMTFRPGGSLFERPRLRSSRKIVSHYRRNLVFGCLVRRATQRNIIRLFSRLACYVRLRRMRETNHGQATSLRAKTVAFPNQGSRRKLNRGDKT